MGDSLVDSVVSDNIPIFTEEEKFNEAVSSIVKRVEAKLTGAEESLISLLVCRTKHACRGVVTALGRVGCNGQQPVTQGRRSGNM